MTDKAPALGLNGAKGLSDPQPPQGLSQPEMLAAGTIAGATIKGGASFTDTLPGVFYPVVIDPTGNVTINSSSNHVSSLKFHDTKNASATDILDYTNNNTRFIVPSSASSIALLLAILDRNILTGANGVEFDPANRRLFFYSNGGGGNAGISWDNASAVTFNGSLNGLKMAHGTGTVTVANGAPGSTVQTISLGTTFSSAPDVVVGIGNANPETTGSVAVIRWDTITTTQFRLVGYNWNGGVSETYTYYWTAVGPA